MEFRFRKSHGDAITMINYVALALFLSLRTRLQVEKHKHTMSSKCQQSDDAKNEYAVQLQKTNRLRQSHYESALPEVVNRFQEIDEKRTKGLKEFIKGTADAEASVAPIVGRCLEGIVKASESINEKADSLTVIERWVKE